MKPNLALLFCLTISLAAVNFAAAEENGSGLVVEAGFGCKVEQGKLVCGKKKKNDDDDDDDDDDDNQKPKPGKATKDCKKARCEPGLVVLDKPNKYGACCEAREGLPPPKTAEPEKCKFPGEVGTPPNCTCPSGTEFLGFRGCVKWTKQRVNCEVLPNKPGAYVRQDSWEQKQCFPLYGKDKTRGSCLNYQGSTEQLECCCEVKVYEK